MLDLLVDLGWKSALIAGFALLASRSLERRPAGERVALLRAAVVALLLLPVLAFAGPELELAVLPALGAAPDMAMALPDAGAAINVAQGAAFDWPLALYAAGAGLLLLHLALGLATLWRWTRAAAPARDLRWLAAMRAARPKRPVRLLVSPSVAAPISWGVRPAWILIGPATERRAEQAEAVIAHELAHVRRFDWPVLIAARLAVLLFWYNPLVWLLDRELARQTELAADAEALRRVGRADYAQTLLTLAGAAAHPAGCGMAITRSALGRRICCVLDAGAARPASPMVCAALLAAAPLAAAPLAATQLVHATVPSAAVAAQAPAPAPAPALAAGITLPSFVPAARAAEVPALRQSRAVVRRMKPIRPATAAPPREAPGSVTPSVELQLHAGHATPPPPAPPAPGSEAAAWQAALAGSARPPAPSRGRPTASRPAGWTDKDEARAVADGMAEAAKRFRLRAQELERVAADGDVASEIRLAHARAAGSLRYQAERLDLQARRKRAGT